LPLNPDDMNAFYRTDLQEMVYLTINDNNEVTYYLELRDYLIKDDYFLRRIPEEAYTDRNGVIAEKTSKDKIYEFSPDEIVEEDKHYYQWFPNDIIKEFEVISGIKKYFYPIDIDYYKLRELKPLEYIN